MLEKDPGMAEKAETVIVKVRLYASFREIAKSSEVTLALSNGSPTVADLKLALRHAYPELTSVKIPIIVAVNRKVATDFTAISGADEIAILPPVSGG